jgi:hypothetical protein
VKITDAGRKNRKLTDSCAGQSEEQDKEDAADPKKELFIYQLIFIVLVLVVVVVALSLHLLSPASFSHE